MDEDEGEGLEEDQHGGAYTGNAEAGGAHAHRAGSVNGGSPRGGVSSSSLRIEPSEVLVKLFSVPASRLACACKGLHVRGACVPPHDSGQAPPHCGPCSAL